MRLIDRFRHWLRAIFREPAVERQVDEELDAWVAELTERYVARGVTPSEARARALNEVGHLDVVKESVRDARPGRGWRGMGPDVRYAWRSLRRTPGLTAAVVLTFALGIGANTAIFSVVSAMLIAPLPYHDPSRLVVIWSDMTDSGYPRAPLSSPELNDLRTRTKLFDGIGAIWSTTGTLTGDGEPEQLRTGLVTTNFFTVLGASPALGRTFGDEDEAKTAGAAIVLSWPLFERRFGADPSLIGRSIVVNSRPTTVAGVMPRDFKLLLPTDASVPDDLQAWTFTKSASFVQAPRGQQFLRVIGRMKSGVTVAAARADVSSVAAAISKQFTEYGPPGRIFRTYALQADDVREVRPALLILACGVAILLLIACVNVAGLLVARAAGRRRETALCIALGAGRQRLFRQYLAEGTLIVLMGSAAGLIAGWLALHGLVTWRPASLARIDRAHVDWTVLGITGLVTVVWALLLSLAPLSESFRTNVLEVLQRGSQRAGNALAVRTRTLLVILQVALSAVLLVGAGLLVRTFVNIQQRDLGFQPDRSFTFRISVPFSRYSSRDAIDGFSRQLLDRLRATPGVQAAGAISHIPFDDLPNWGGGYILQPGANAASAPVADYRAVTAGLFETAGVRLIEGRFFTEDDDRNHPLSVVVDDILARRAWPGRSAVGQTLIVDPGANGTPTIPARVIGVVGHLRLRSVIEDLSEQVYFSERQVLRNPMAYVLRTTGDPASLVRDVRQAVASIDAAVPVFDPRPFASYVDQARSGNRFLALLAASFAVVALMLTAVGVYGVIAYTVTERRREFGVRLALGAARGQIVALVLRRGALLAGTGLAAGAMTAVVAAYALRDQLVGVLPTDPLSYGIAAAVLAAAAATATWIPARRATTADPLDALRRD
jgi:predicted permease